MRRKLIYSIIIFALIMTCFSVFSACQNADVTPSIKRVMVINNSLLNDFRNITDREILDQKVEKFAQDHEDKIYFPENYDNAYLLIQFDNPTNYDIKRIVLDNHQSFSESSFLKGSDNKYVIIKSDIHGSRGYVTRKIHGVEYDQDNVKRTIYPDSEIVLAIGADFDMITAEVNNIKTTGESLECQVWISDRYNLAQADTSFKMLVYDESGMVVARQNIENTSSNFVKINNLNPLLKLSFKVVGEYDALDGKGKTEHVLYSGTFPHNMQYISNGDMHYSVCTRCGYIEKYENHDYSYDHGKCICGKECPYTYDLNFKEIGINAYTVTKYYGEEKNIVIPDTFKGVPVIEIEDYAFYGSNIESVTIGDNVNKINNFAFASCSKLATVNFGNGLIDLGQNAFQDCIALTNIELKNEIIYLRDNAFSGCSKLETIFLPSSLDIIGAGAFRDCSSLKTINMTDGVRNIGSRAFANCKALQSVILSDSLMELDYLFEGCDSLTNLHIPIGIESIDNSVLSGCKNLESLNISKYVTYINVEIVQNLKNLVDIVVDDYNNNYYSINNCLVEYQNKKLIYVGKDVQDLPPGIEQIAPKALSNNIGLVNVTLPSSLHSIGIQSFYNVRNLYSIDINQVSSIGEEAFKDCKKLTDIKLNNNLVEIMPKAFEHCESLTSINLPASINSLGHGIFNGCYSLNNVQVNENNNYYSASSNCILSKDGKILEIGFENSQVPISVEKIAGNSFLDCDISELILPLSVVEISGFAISNCQNLEKLLLRNGVQNVGYHAIDKCPLVKIYSEAHYSGSNWDDNWNPCSYPIIWDCNNNNISADGKIYVKNNNINYIIDNYYYTASVDKQSKNLSGDIVIPKIIMYEDIEIKVTNIETRAFENCSGITSVNIDADVKLIPEYAFSNCRKMVNVQLSNNITTISNYAFSNCESLKEIFISRNINSMGAGVFSGCSSLEINTEYLEQPYSWNYDWCDSNTKVNWGVFKL